MTTFNPRPTASVNSPRKASIAESVADSQEVLTGDLADGSNSTCLYSSKQNLVDLFKDALKNEIKLIELLPEAEKGEKE